LNPGQGSRGVAIGPKQSEFVIGSRPLATSGTDSGPLRTISFCDEGPRAFDRSRLVALLGVALAEAAAAGDDVAARVASDAIARLLGGVGSP
jgi:hypothetical protein